MVFDAPQSVSEETPRTRVGDLFLRNYDEAVIKKLGGLVYAGQYFVKVPGVEPPPFSDEWPIVADRRKGMPGIPIVFASPNDALTHYVNPQFVVRRQDPELDMSRWNQQKKKYFTKVDNAEKLTVELGRGIDKDGKPYVRTIEGYGAHESQRWPWPYDITYTIYFRAEGERAETMATNLLRHLMFSFNPRDGIDVTDSLGDVNSYWLRTQAPTGLSEAIDIANRVRGWAMTVSISGYLDQNYPVEEKAVTTAPHPNMKRMEEDV